MYTSEATFLFIAIAFGSVLFGSLIIALTYSLIRYFADDGVGRRVSTVFWTCIKIGISLVAGYLALDKAIVILQLLLR